MSLCVNNAVIDLFNFKKSQSLKKRRILEYLCNIIIQDKYSKVHYGVKVFMVFTIYKSCFVRKNLYYWIQNNILKLYSFLLQGWNWC